MMWGAYAAALAALLATGLLLVAAGLRPGPAAASRAPAAGRLRRWWRGDGGTAADRRARRVTVAVAAAAGGAAFLVTGVPVAALLAAAAVPGLPWLWHAGRREQRAVARAEAVGQWIGRLKDRLATGSGLLEALVGSGAAAPAAISGQVRSLADRLRAGTPPPQALHWFADEVDDSVAEQAVAALLLHLEDRGENLPEVLEALSTDAARVVSTRREVHAKRAQPRMTVRFMIVLAGVVTVVLSYTGLLATYGTAAGQVVLAVLAAGFAAVLAWVHSLCSPPTAPRFLTPAAAGRA